MPEDEDDSYDLSPEEKAKWEAKLAERLDFVKPSADGTPWTDRETSDAENKRGEGEFVGLVDLVQANAEEVIGAASVRELRAVHDTVKGRVFVTIEDDPIRVEARTTGAMQYLPRSMGDITRSGFYVGVGRDVPGAVEDLRAKLKTRGATAEWHTPAADNEGQAKFPKPRIVR